MLNVLWHWLIVAVILVVVTGGVWRARHRLVIGKHVRDLGHFLQVHADQDLTYLYQLLQSVRWTMWLHWVTLAVNVSISVAIARGLLMPTGQLWVIGLLLAGLLLSDSGLTVAAWRTIKLVQRHYLRLVPRINEVELKALQRWLTVAIVVSFGSLMWVGGACWQLYQMLG